MNQPAEPSPTSNGPSLGRYGFILPRGDLAADEQHAARIAGFELASAIEVENDVQKRDEMLTKAFRLIHDEVGLIPLHQQALSWGISKKVSMAQRADNRILFYWVRVQ